MKNRNESIDIFRGIGIIFMVIGHANFGDLFSVYKSSFNMPIFFFISGYLFQPDHYDKFFPYLRKKCRTLLIPYCTFAVITIIYCLFVNFGSNAIVYDVLNSMKGLIWSNQAIFPITGAIWYLQCTFIIEIVFFLLYKHFSNIVLVLFIIAFLLLGPVLTCLGISLPFSIDTALCGIVFYALGFCLKKTDLDKKLLKNVNSIFVILIFIVNLIFIFLNGEVNPRTCIYNFVPLFYINACVSIYIYWILSIKLSKCKILICLKNNIVYIGINSIVYLGLNQIILNILYRSSELIYPIQSLMLRGLRNIIFCVITILIIRAISVFINQTKLKSLIGK